MIASLSRGLMIDNSGGVKSYWRPGTKARFVLLPARSCPVMDMVYSAFSTTVGLLDNSISIWSPNVRSDAISVAV